MYKKMTPSLLCVHYKTVHCSRFTTQPTVQQGRANKCLRTSDKVLNIKRLFLKLMKVLMTVNTLASRFSFLHYLILKIEALRYVETPAATIYQAILRNIPEDLKLHPTNFNSTSGSD